MPKQHSPGVGIEFEILVPAYFALELNNNKDVENFSIRSNADKDFGNLDDVVITLELKNGSKHNFAFQLKHKESSHKNLLPGNFEANGNFSLEKYCSAFKNMKEEFKTFRFILYTNANFDSKKTREVTNFDMTANGNCPGNVYFNTSSGQGNVYKFDVNGKTQDWRSVKKEDFGEFFPQFSVYTNQKNFKGLKENILEILKFEEIFLKYVELFRKWHQGEFTSKTIEKKALNLHLIHIYLTPFAIGSHLSNGQNQNLELFETVVKQFDVTIIEDSLGNFKNELVEYKVTEYLDKCSRSLIKEQLEKHMKEYKMDFVQQFDDCPDETIDKCVVYLAKEYKFVEKSEKNLKEETKLTILHYFFEKPLILNFNDTSKDLIYKGMELCDFGIKNKIKLVIVGLVIDVKKLSVCQYEVFKCLKDLSNIDSGLYEDIIKNSTLSLQGRRAISLEQLITFHKEIAEFTKVRELFLMLKNGYLVGEEKEELSSHYTARSVAVTLVDIQTALEHCRKTNDLLVIYFYRISFTYFQEMLQENLINAIEIENFENVQFSQGIGVVSTSGECSVTQFQKVCQQNSNRNIHYFKMLSNLSLMLVMSSKNTFRSVKPELTKGCLDQEYIYSVLNVPLNIMCAPPGMGKSTLLRFLKNKCPSSMWALYVDLKAYNSYLKEQRNSFELLMHIMNIELNVQDDSFVKELKTILLRRRKVVMLLDGLDEIESTSVENILDHVKNLCSMKYPIWLSSRENLQATLEDHFNIFSIEIIEFSQEQQRDYAHQRLQLKYKQNEAEEIASKIFNNMTYNNELLGIPLQLQIITEIFLNERFYQNLNENMFVLTKMYRFLFEGRYKYSLEKLQSKNPHLTIGQIQDYLENYEVAALQSLFNNDILIRELNLDLRRNNRFLEEIKKEKDPLGIIVKINMENQAVFEHFTYAEYFACVFLVHNFDKVRILQRYLFSETYQNLFLIFNIMLAEDNDLHLAVIYKDIDQIKKYINNSWMLDKGGRSVLHIATVNGIGLAHSKLSRGKNYIADHHIDFLAEKNITESSKIFTYLIECSKVSPFEDDEVFVWNAVEYSLAFGSLYMVELILEKCDHFSSDILWKYFDEVSVAYYSLKFGYPKLLGIILAKNNCLLNNLSTFAYSCYEHISILYLCLLIHCTKKFEIIKLLIDDYEDKQKMNHGGLLHWFRKKLTRNKETKLSTHIFELLHFASMEGDIDVMNYLLDRGIDVDFVNSSGETALCLAIEQQQVDAVSLLLEKGANVNIKTNIDETPLHFAADVGSIVIMDLLLKKGADIEGKGDEDDDSVLSTAARAGHLEAVNFLIEKGASFDATILHDSAFGGNIKMIEMFLNKGFDINSKDLHSETPLYNAIYNSETDVVEFLLGKNADVNVISKYEETILHKTFKRFSVKNLYRMVEILLDRIDINLLYVVDFNGATPLHLAVYKSTVAVVELLLRKGMDLHRITADNPLYSLRSAVQGGHLQADLLLELTRSLVGERKGKMMNYGEYLS